MNPNRTCKFCRHFDDLENEEKEGLCHLNPPVAYQHERWFEGSKELQTDFCFPVVSFRSWCSHFSPAIPPGDQPKEKSMLEGLKKVESMLSSWLDELRKKITELESATPPKVGDELPPVKEPENVVKMNETTTDGPGAPPPPPPPIETKPCPACGGTGQDSRGTIENPMPCDHCGGLATVKTDPAPAPAA